MPNQEATDRAIHAHLTTAHRNQVAANRATGRPADEFTAGLLWAAGEIAVQLEQWEYDPPEQYFEDYPEEVSDD